MDAATAPDITQVAWRRRRALACVTIAAGVAGVLITWLFVPRTYSATAQVLYESSQTPLLSAKALVGQDAETRGQLESMPSLPRSTTGIPAARRSSCSADSIHTKKAEK